MLRSALFFVAGSATTVYLLRWPLLIAVEASVPHIVEWGFQKIDKNLLRTEKMVFGDDLTGIRNTRSSTYGTRRPNS